jgi:hypothetical protein
MFEAYSHSNHKGLIAASCIEKEVRFGSGSEVSNSANEVRSSSSNRRRPDSVSSSGSCWLPGMEYLFDGLFRVLDPRAVLAIVLLCFELLQETETRRSGRMS